MADYPDYSDVTIVRAPFRNEGSSPCSNGGVNVMLGVIVLAGVGLFFAWTKLQIMDNNGRDIARNSVGHLLDFVWKG